MRVIRKVEKAELQDYLYRLNLDDKNIYSELNKENTIGIFQFNGSLASGITKQVCPTNFDEMIAINALARPGTSSFVPDYISGRDEGTQRYPEKVSELLTETYNLCLFQEQVMSIFNVIGNFSLEETNNIRGLMKRLGKAEKSDKDLEEWDKAVAKFIEGAIENGLTKEDANSVAEDLLRMSSYNFNKSHATSYSYIAVMTLYLSFYFKKYFLASVLQNHIEDGKNVFETVQAARNQNIEVLPPDINKSKSGASALEDDTLLFGLNNIKKVSDTSAEEIIWNRPYESLFDFILRTSGRKVRVDVIKALISVGAFDFETPERKRLLLALEIFWKNKKTIKVKEKLQVIWEKGYKEAMAIKGLGITNSDLKEFENAYLGGNFFTSSFSNKLLAAFKKLKERGLIYYSFSEVGEIPKKVPVCIQNMRLHTDKNGNEMAFIVAEDVVGQTQRFPIFASFWKFIKDDITNSTFIFIQVYQSDSGLMFGSNRWIGNERLIRRMIKTIE